MLAKLEIRGWVAASGATVWPAKGRIGLDGGTELKGAWVLDERLLAFRAQRRIVDLLGGSF